VSARVIPADVKAAEKAHLLLERATHASTPAEEARTCGFLLARIIADHGLAIVAGSTLAFVASFMPPPGPVPQSPQASTGGYHRIRSKFGGACSVCGRSFGAGVSIAWKRGAPTMHWACKGAV
jgi:hypothetical protein